MVANYVRKAAEWPSSNECVKIDGLVSYWQVSQQSTTHLSTWTRSLSSTLCCSSRKMTNYGSIKITSTWRTWNLRVPASGVIVIVSLSYSHGSLPYIVISYHLWLFYQNRTCQTDHKRYPCFKLSATKRYRSSYRGSASSTLHIRNGYRSIVWQTCVKYKVINTRTYPQDRKYHTGDRLGQDWKHTHTDSG